MRCDTHRRQPAAAPRCFAGDGIFGGNDQWQLTVYDKAVPNTGLAGRRHYVPDFPGPLLQVRRGQGGNPLTGRTCPRELAGPAGLGPQTHQGKITNTRLFSAATCRASGRSCHYLKELGVTCLYLNPIFRSPTPTTGTTRRTTPKSTPCWGTKRTSARLCQEAKELGIRVVIDGVFSHTGSDSVYFNREGRYPTAGRLPTPSSPPIIPGTPSGSGPITTTAGGTSTPCPNVQETNPSYDAYINGKEGIVRKWLAAGASGWRLDVADELPDPFLDSLTAAAKAQRPGCPGAGGGVGGRLQQDGLRRAPAVPAGPAAGHRDELPLPGRHLGLPAGGRPAEFRRRRWRASARTTRPNACGC